MKKALLPFVLLAFSMILSAPCFGQDPLAEHKIKGLKGLRTLSVVIRANIPKEIASLKEWGDMVELGLHGKIPELPLSQTKLQTAWLELSVVTIDEGGFLELSVFRWVRVLDSGEEIFSKVWWETRLVFGAASKKNFQDALDVLLTSFAADYLRAKR